MTMATNLDLAKIKLEWPVAGPKILTQGFGENPANYAKFGYPGHNGIDLDTDSSAVLAAAGGTVIRAEWDTYGYGFLVILEHEFGEGGSTPPLRCETLYAHLKVIHVAVGTRVVVGQALGISDSTGNSTGDHLHFELRVAALAGGAYKKGQIDPLPFFTAIERPGGGVRPEERDGDNGARRAVPVQVGKRARVRADALPWINLRTAASLEAKTDIGDLYPLTDLPEVERIVIAEGRRWAGMLFWVAVDYLEGVE